MTARITLAEALREDRLADFIAQAEAEGVGPANGADFNANLGAVIAPPPAGQTSRLPARGGSGGK
jgi:hypothetical protein